MRLLALLLCPVLAFGAISEGSTGWTCTVYENPTGDLDGISLTVDSGSNRVFVATFIAAFANPAEMAIDTIGGQAPTGNDAFDLGGDNDNGNIEAWVWNESAIAAMSGSAVSLTDSHSDDFAFCYATLTDVQQTGLASFAFLDEQSVTGATSDDVDTTSVSGDYIVVLAGGDSATTEFSDWDTLTEEQDVNTVQGWRAGVGAGNGGDNTTTVTRASSDDIALASFVFTQQPSATGAPKRRRLSL